MKNNSAVVASNNDEDVTLSLPIRKRDLGDFISQLLGQQQSIERNISAIFDIDHEWIINLHELINQRIHQQADAHLTSFNVVIYFEDGLKRTLTTVDALIAYSETKKQIPTGIKIIWIYLVQFPGKSYPEKQQISFSAQIGSEKSKNQRIITDTSESLAVERIVRASERGFLNFQIDHTERTWGDDIETIISNQIRQIIRGDQIKYPLFEVARYLLAITILILCIFYPLYMETSSKHKAIEGAMAGYLALKSASSLITLESVHEKLDHLADLTKLAGDSNLVDISLFFMFAGPPLALAFLAITRRNTHSFLVLSKESEKHRALMLSREKRSVWILIGSFIVSVIAGIVGNYGFAWLGH